MREITIKLYSFDELSEKAKQKAIADHGDINVDYDWWDYDYDDMRQVGIEPRGFDLDRGNYLDIHIPSTETTAKKILENHGEDCGTYKCAEQFLLALQTFEKRCGEDSEEVALTKESFKKAIAEEYLKILKTEYEFRTSDGQVAETLQCNGYEFTENGKMYST